MTRKGEDFSIIMEGCRKNVLKYDVLLFNFVPPIKPSFHNFYFMLLLLPFLSIDNDDASKTYWCSWIINLHAYVWGQKHANKCKFIFSAFLSCQISGFIEWIDSERKSCVKIVMKFSFIVCVACVHWMKFIFYNLRSISVKEVLNCVSVTLHSIKKIQFIFLKF